MLGTALGAPPVPGSGGGVRLDVKVVDATQDRPSTVFEQHGVTVTALGVPHGNLPTLAYRVQVRGVSIVFGADQTGTNPKFVDFARGAKLLVMHLAVGPGPANALHATPGVVGRLAREAGAERLIVSHLGPFDIDAALVELKKNYTGALTVGADLQCTPLP